MLFKPYRSLGFVCNGAAKPIVHKLGDAEFIIAPVDDSRAVHLYDARSLRIVSSYSPSEKVQADNDIQKFTTHMAHDDNDLQESDIAVLYVNNTSIADKARINLIAAAGDWTFLGFQGSSEITVLHSFKYHSTLKTQYDEIPSYLYVVSNAALIILSKQSKSMQVWSLPSKERGIKSANIFKHMAQIEFDLDFVPSTVTHPPTYLNKVLVGSVSGRLQLWNINSCKKIHEFPAFPSSITVLEPSPVLHVIAIGLSDGRIVLKNVQQDVDITTFRHVPEGSASVSAITFRTDGVVEVMASASDPVNMTTEEGENATATSTGQIAVWDLNGDRIDGIISNSHEGGISMLVFLYGHPIMVSASAKSNSLKLHIFDAPRAKVTSVTGEEIHSGIGSWASSGPPRVWKYRQGHYAPPTSIRFCGDDPRFLLSTGLDHQLRLTSTFRDASNRQFSTKSVIPTRSGSFKKLGKLAKKRRRLEKQLELGTTPEDAADLFVASFPIIKQFSSSGTRFRDTDYANVVSVHEDTKAAYLWRSESISIVEKPLLPKSAMEDIGVATATAASKCGNYAVVGYKSGSIYLYSMQSGRCIGAFQHTTQDNKTVKSHKSCISLLAIDALSQTLISGSARDGTLKFWELSSRKFLESLDIGIGVQGGIWSMTSDLIAVSCDDFSLRVIDGDTKKIARKFAKHVAPVTDMAFSQNGRWLLSTSMDGNLLTWDLPSGVLIDCIRCAKAPTSVAVSPDGQFIATSHVGSLGITLWVDTTRFLPADGKTDLLSLSQMMERDTNSSEEGSSKSSSGDSSSDERSDDGDESMLPKESSSDEKKVLKEEFFVKALYPNLTTLSKAPPSRWTVLSNLQSIKERNKPIEAVKKPEHAPFFLPTVAGPEVKFDLSGFVEETPEKKNKGKGSQPGVEKNEDLQIEYGGKFANYVVRGEYKRARAFLCGMGPSGVDMELRWIDSAEARVCAGRYFLEQLDGKLEFELTEAHLGVFLSAHGLELAKDPGNHELLESLRQAHSHAWDKMNDLLGSIQTLSAYFSGQL